MPRAPGGVNLDSMSFAFMRLSDRSSVLVGIALVLCFVGLTNHGVWLPDEPRVAEIGRAMLASGDLVVPRVGGLPFLEHPPLVWWLMLPTLAALGPSAAAARLPVGVACAAVVLLVADLTRLVAGRKAGGAAALVVATTGGVAWHGHRCVVDPWLMAAVTLGLWSLVRALRPRAGDDHAATPTAAPPRAGWLVLAYVAAGLAFLAKGPVGLVLLGGPGLALVLVLGRLRSFFATPAHLAGAACLVALTLTWPLLLHAHGGEALVGQFLRDTVGRRLADTGDGAPEHSKGIHFYLLHAPLLAFPWTLTLPAVGAWLWSRPLPAGWSRRGLMAIGLALPVGMALLTIPVTKRPIYLLPVLPMLAPLVGAWLIATRDDARALDRAAQASLLVACPLALLGGLGLAWVADAGAPSEKRWVAALEGTFPGWAVAALAAACVAGVVLASMGLRSWRARAPQTGTAALLLVALVALTHHAVVYPALDGARGPKPFASFVRRTCGTAPTFGYMLDETMVALASFEAGVLVQWSWDASDLREFVASRPGGRVILLERIDGLIPDDLRPSLRLRERWVASRRRVYLAYEVPPP